MFGYIVPVKAELKVKEFDAFKALYCGLCHTMGKEYGFVTRFLLNYDFVFLTMLLWDKNEKPETAGKRCAACPFQKKACCKTNSAMKSAAGMSVILSWWKIMDGVSDSRGIKALVYRFFSLIYRKAYRKALKEFPEFDAAVKNGIERLNELERESCTSLDETADCFAGILKAAAVGQNETKRRILEQILYHTGRWIYIVDACDDLKKDVSEGNYNPVKERFGEITEIEGETKARLETTLLHSRNLAGNAFELLDLTAWSGIIRNIIFLGMPNVCTSVLDGKWRQKRTGAPK